jgi:peptidoglycan/LPS O-acetylase OafA/YrhL
MFALHGRIWWQGVRQAEPDLIGLLSVSCLMNLLVVPYVWSWDFVLTLPLLLLVWTRLRTRRALLVFGAGFAAVWAATVAVRLTTDGDDVRFWFVPWGVLIVAALSLWAEKLRQRSARRSREIGHGTAVSSSTDVQK